MSSPPQLLRKILLATLLSCAVFVLFGCVYNADSSKFSRSRNTACSRGILSLHTKDSHICCDSPEHESTWICAASFDPLNSWFSSYWALVIPAVPCAINSVLNGDKPVQSLKRMLIYITIFVLRTGLLYKAPALLQDWVQRPAPGYQPPCWCPEHVSTAKCLLPFDFSDHIVLNMVQFLLPCALELHYSLTMICSSAVSAPSSSSSSNSNGVRPRGAYGVFARWCAATACLVIMLTSLRSLLLTCMFFHTVAENAVGFAIAAAVFCLPLCSPAIANLWISLSKND